MSDNNNLVLVSNNVQPAVIDYNYEAVKKCVELKAQQYAGIIVTDDNLKQAKQDRDNLASARVAIDKFRKAKKKEMSVNIDLMENSARSLFPLLKVLRSLFRPVLMSTIMKNAKSVDSRR